MRHLLGPAGLRLRTGLRPPDGLRPPAGLRLAAVLLALALTLCGCGAGGGTGEGPRITLDGAAWDGGAVSPDAGDMRVYVTLDGEALIDLPFGEPHTLTIAQPGVGENTVAITPESVYMLHADCENQDCVQMGAVTRENIEARVMGGFIVCLPHRLSVEVRGE
ncbi:MAG: NusG domain II-containing protein [Clostridia bacterium]|nr:NusG domain II-containing protein [Clostridia bacterium]